VAAEYNVAGTAGDKAAFAGGRTGSFNLPTPDTGMEEEILKYVNEDRVALGLPALKLEENESHIAEKHSENMASGKVGFGHTGFNNRAKAIQKVLGSVSAVAENVAEGPMTAREVVDGWLHSPGHKKNIEGNYTLTGIGYAADKKGNIYFTQLFSR
jgi:uncharacterized protein YkwD